MPEVALLEVHHAEHVEALDADQVRVEDWPELMVAGEGVTVTAGTEFKLGEWTIFTERESPPARALVVGAPIVRVVGLQLVDVQYVESMRYVYPAPKDWVEMV